MYNAQKVPKSKLAYMYMYTAETMLTFLKNEKIVNVVVPSLTVMGPLC